MPLMPLRPQANITQPPQAAEPRYEGNTNPRNHAENWPATTRRESHRDASPGHDQTRAAYRRSASTHRGRNRGPSKPNKPDACDTIGTGGDNRPAPWLPINANAQAEGPAPTD